MPKLEPENIQDPNFLKNRRFSLRRPSQQDKEEIHAEKFGIVQLKPMIKTMTSANKGVLSEMSSKVANLLRKIFYFSINNELFSKKSFNTKFSRL